MARIAVYSLKGGVGKTTVAVNLAWCSARQSARRTLLWDLDPQAASTYLLGIAPRPKRRAQAVFSRDIDPADLVRHTDIDRLDLIPADTSLRTLDLLFHEIDKKKRLAKLLGQLDKSYDRLLLDCPPGLTETSEQVMRAADLILIPVIPSPLSQRAFEEVSAHFADRGFKAALMPVHSMVDRRRTLHRDAIARHPDWPVLPMASIVEAMTAERRPVGALSPRSQGARAFAQLWTRVERRLADIEAS
ncbi:ParA family protein [Stakelama tenebrarum]|uniref:ParA family protein n=1 Tax=Stakelama tenebrarum TaxID=2711215 RepID=A0A6G6Y5C3_9SPHN|nr:ParA family protein [Sphingosinithalassobacter tenebrarum]QIG79793.1 ParA family protein [Sphingosinithalassobacter tenebrarum]